MAYIVSVADELNKRKRQLVKVEACINGVGESTVLYDMCRIALDLLKKEIDDLERKANKSFLKLGKP